VCAVYEAFTEPALTHPIAQTHMLSRERSGYEMQLVVVCGRCTRIRLWDRVILRLRIPVWLDLVGSSEFGILGILVEKGVDTLAQAHYEYNSRGLREEM
jgi:hypothetical protein